MTLKNAPFKASLLAATIALVGCDADDSSSKSADIIIETPETYLISAKGGNSEAQRGGNGGRVSISKGNSAAALNVKSTGELSSAYSLPTTTTYFGLNPVTISEDLTIGFPEREEDEDLLTELILEEGTLYFIESSARLYKADGINELGNASHVVTGLLVEEGATLTLSPNRSSSVDLALANDIENNGIITTENPENTDTTSTPNRRYNLNIYAAAYAGIGDISLEGTAIVNDQGQSGGYLEIEALTISNSGNINVSGADFLNYEGAEGGTVTGSAGSPGDVDFNAFVFIENTGDINLNGGNSEGQYGAEGGDLEFNALEIYNTGNITANSGNGATSDSSYNSADNDIEFFAIRTIVNSGNLSATGSNTTDGNAGSGGDIRLEIYGGEGGEGALLDGRLVSTGSITVDGGDATGAEGSYRGGYAGDIRLSVYEGGEGGERAGAHELSVSGDLSLNGGDSVDFDAGEGGYLRIKLEASADSDLELNLAAYEEINTSGGSGEDGYEAGYIHIYTYGGDYDDVSLAGPVNVSTNLIAKGGEALMTAVEGAEGAQIQEGEGGEGGSISLDVYTEYAYLQPDELTLNVSGNIDTSGADSYLSADEDSEGGLIRMHAPHALVADVTIVANGGGDTYESLDDDYTEGSEGGSIYISSLEGNISFSGSVTANGGDATHEGGEGGLFFANAKAGSNISASLELNGGNAIISAEGAEGNEDTRGGDGGFAKLSTGEYNTSFTGTFTANPGTGDYNGLTLGLVVDADCVVGECGNYLYDEPSFSLTKR